MQKCLEVIAHYFTGAKHEADLPWHYSYLCFDEWSLHFLQCSLVQKKNNNIEKAKEINNIATIQQKLLKQLEKLLKTPDEKLSTPGKTQGS